MGISNFLIYGQFVIDENCCNFRTRNDNDTKPGAVTKLGKRNTTTLKKFDDDIMWANFEL